MFCPQNATRVNYRLVAGTPADANKAAGKKEMGSASADEKRPPRRVRPVAKTIEAIQKTLKKRGPRSVSTIRAGPHSRSAEHRFTGC
jgi:hypothetical protein